MGAIADAVVSFAQPLIDKTDGSFDQMQKAFAIGQACWNLAILPHEERDKALGRICKAMELDAEAIEEFRRDIVLPMIRRHEEMFPQMHRRAASRHASVTSIPNPKPAKPPPLLTPPTRMEGRSGIGRNSPCPCNSGRKYKQCCGR